VQGAMRVTFSDALDPASVTPAACAFRIWSLKRTADYGSPHVGEHPLEITGASLSQDGRTLTVNIPALVTTQCYELNVKFKAPDGSPVERSIHGTIHRLSAP